MIRKTHVGAAGDYKRTSRSSALRNGIRSAWAVPRPLTKQIGMATRNGLLALRHWHLFDDQLQAERMRRISDLVDGKSVAVVGNAQSLMDREFGREIDAHEVVVRFNHGFIVSPTSQGTRTSIHSLACAVDMQRAAREWPEAAFVYVSPVRYFLPVELRDLKSRCACIPLREWEKLASKIPGGRPSSGLIMLNYLLRSRCRNISLYGFDWMQTKSFYHSGRKVGSWHSGEMERRLVEDWTRLYPGRLRSRGGPDGSPIS